MNLKFSKYQGTGNDFVMLNEVDLFGNDLSISQIQKLCDRRFGIGADGLIIIRKDKLLDFYVDYYNADGSQSFCGNGARCSVKFAKELGLVDKNCQFSAIDGPHEAEIIDSGEIRLFMSPVASLEFRSDESVVLNTGSPHLVCFVDIVDSVNIIEYGRKIRYSPEFEKTGINVNIAQKTDDKIIVRTYERGVEDETLSCGTGVTAVALAAAKQTKANSGCTVIETKGGLLKVHWKKQRVGFDSIYLEGPAEKVYDGRIEL